MINKDSIYLDCPYSEKDEAKKLGARFDGIVKKWFIPPGLEIEKFARWSPKQPNLFDAETPLSKEETRVGVEVPVNRDDPRTDGIDSSFSHSPHPQSLSLHELMSQLKQTIEQHHATRYWVRAEVVNVSAKKHVYIELSDHDSNGREVAQMQATLWQERAASLLPQFEQQTGLPFKPGIKVLLQVQVQFHSVYGLSLNILDIDPNFTLGDIEAKLIRLRALLQQEGIYQQNRQLPPVREFCKVAVIAPAQAAGLGDFKSQADVLTQQGLCQFFYYTASFQGAQTVSEIPTAIRLVTQDHQSTPFDALVLIRGGGAKSDLYQLNEYDIAKAICTAPLPVIVGIGHERDKTLLDEVAQQSCHTPSLVIAQITTTIVQNARQAKQQWQWLLKLASELTHTAKANHERLYATLREQVVKRLGEQKKQVETVKQQVKHASDQQLNNARHQIKLLMEQVLLSDPHSIMQRGYAIVRNSDNQVLPTKALAEMENSLIIEFQDGRIHCQHYSDIPT